MHVSYVRYASTSIGVLHVIGVIVCEPTRQLLELSGVSLELRNVIAQRLIDLPSQERRVDYHHTLALLASLLKVEGKLRAFLDSGLVNQAVAKSSVKLPGMLFITEARERLLGKKPEAISVVAVPKASQGVDTGHQ